MTLRERQLLPLIAATLKRIPPVLASLRLRGLLLRPPLTLGEGLLGG